MISISLNRRTARDLKSTTLAAVAALGFAAAALAQQPAETLPGFKPNNVFESHGIDHVNLFNGDPGIVVPLGPEYPLGPGNSWQLKAYYSAKFWRFDTSCDYEGVRHAVVSGYPALGAGWTLDLGYVNDTGPQGFVFYHSADGGRHQFGSSGRSNLTMDGSHLRVTTYFSGSQVDHYTVELPNGNVQTFAHRYLGPTPVSGTSYDFTDYTDWGINTDRFGLTSIRDSFGSTLLAVDYAASYPDRNAWRVSRINLTRGTPQARTITYNWGTKQIGTIGSVTWDVVNSIDFPAIGGQTLNVALAFDTPAGSGATPTFWRNSYDNSISAGQCQNAGNSVFVPLLDSVTFSGSSISSLGYSFAYVLDNPDGDPGYHYRDGVLRHIGLPTGGLIDYTYAQTVGSCFESGGGCEDPEIGLDPGQARPTAPLTPDQQDFTRYWDSSAGVLTRTETDPVSGASPATASYDRYQFVPGGIYPDPIDDLGIARRTIVTEPAGNGSPSYATRYLFHVDVTSAVFASGIELERRYYSGPNALGTPLRTLVNCYEDDLGATGQCGYRDSSGAIQDYTVRDNIRQQRQLTWYGVNPTQGGTCPTGSTPCTGP